MAKYIKTDKLQNNLFVPLKLSNQIIQGTLAHTIEYIIDNKVDIPRWRELPLTRKDYPVYGKSQSRNLTTVILIVILSP
jgi:hypothetical protein